MKHVWAHMVEPSVVVGAGLWVAGLGGADKGSRGVAGKGDKGGGVAMNLAWRGMIGILARA